MEGVKFSARDRLKVCLLAATAIPFVLVVVAKMGYTNPFLVMGATGLAIVAAAFFLSIATESLQTVVSQALALAILALIQVLPEYSFEVVLAWKRQLQFAAATMTGANRLLMGLGWPLVFFVALVSSARKGRVMTEIRLGKNQSAAVVFLLLSSLYSLVMIVRQRITLVDSAVLVAIYGAYIVVVSRLPPEAGECREPESLGNKVVCLTGWRKALSIGALLAFGFFVIFLGAEPFIESLKTVAVDLGLDQFLFVQWFAPFLSEFPESLTAFIWAGMVTLAAMGISNLITSKVNQWTLLVASIPIAYSISMQRASSIPLDTQQLHELILTTAQTVYGAVCLFGLRFKLRHAITLLVLFAVQFAVPATRLVITYIFVLLIPAELIVQRREVRVFVSFVEVMKRSRRKVTRAISRAAGA